MKMNMTKNNLVMYCNGGGDYDDDYGDDTPPPLQYIQQSV